MKDQRNKYQGVVHLVLPDSHAHPDYNNDRYTWLGKLIVDLRPDVIVDLGDFADMPSLCSYDKGTKGFEGRRYSLDIKANIDANEKLFAPIHEYNDKMIAGKRKRYKPRTVKLLGNHENRINRAIESDAILDGTISVADLQNEKYWDEVHPFLTPVDVDGVLYNHYFTSGVMNRPIGGENPAARMLSKSFMSCTAGHAHTRDFAERTGPNGRKLLGMVAGVYQDYDADYAGPANKLWWRGVVVKTFIDYGVYDHEWISLDRIKKEYGNE